LGIILEEPLGVEIDISPKAALLRMWEGGGDLWRAAEALMPSTSSSLGVEVGTSGPLEGMTLQMELVVVEVVEEG
jgi:hypothetical protein